MAAKGALGALIENVSSIAGERGKDTPWTLAADAGIGVSTAARALGHTPGEIRTETIDKLAKWVGVEPWRLVAPKLGTDVLALLPEDEQDLLRSFRERVRASTGTLPEAAPPTYTKRSVTQRPTTPNADQKFGAGKNPPRKRSK